MRKLSTLAVLLVAGFLALSPFQPVSAHAQLSNPRQESIPSETPRASAPAPAEIINAVNNLRLSHGLNALNAHPVLMQVAAEQASALAASEGAVGHERPCGLTLGQELLMRGYPLLGDLSMDGYRSENWVTASTAEDAISFWLSDDEHTNTMLSPTRSDIGAAVAVSDQIYVVLETALSTSSGQMQYDAYAILTGIPLTQNACIGIITQNAEYGNLSQYSIPVVVNTALPGGEVIHEVKYGQTLWSIAIQYGTTIAQIKRLNHLSSEVISPGQKLIVQQNATQPAPNTATPIPAADRFIFTVTPSPTSSPTADSAQATPTSSAQALKENGVVIVAVIISFSVMLAGLGFFRKKKGIYSGLYKK